MGCSHGVAKDRTDRPTNTLTFTVSHWMPRPSGAVPSTSPNPRTQCPAAWATLLLQDSTIKVSSSAGEDQRANFRARGPGLHCFTAVQLWASLTSLCLHILICDKG